MTQPQIQTVTEKNRMIDVLIIQRDEAEASLREAQEQVAVLQSQVDNADINLEQVRLIERHKAEASLREQEERNEKLAELVELVEDCCNRLADVGERWDVERFKARLLALRERVALNLHPPQTEL